jgi:hypothetical protein
MTSVINSVFARSVSDEAISGFAFCKRLQGLFNHNSSFAPQELAVEWLFLDSGARDTGFAGMDDGNVNRMSFFSSHRQKPVSRGA